MLTIFLNLRTFFNPKNWLAGEKQVFPCLQGTRTQHLSLYVCVWCVVCVVADLEKAASGASGACGHFVENLANLRTFSVKYPVLLAEDQGRRVEDGDLRLDKGDLRYEDDE